MIEDPRPDLAAAVRGLLVAQGHAEVASLLDGASLEVCAREESWQMGARTVTAQRFAWVLSPQAYAALHQHAGAISFVRDGLAAAVRSFDTELAEMIWCVKLASVGSWGRAYRSAPTWSPPTPSPRAVAAVLGELARAYGETDIADILDRAELEVGDVPNTAGLQRWVVRLDPDDFVFVEREPLRRSRVEQMVRAVAAGPEVVVGEVMVAVKR